MRLTKKSRELFRRVIPLILAALMLLGVVYSAFISIRANDDLTVGSSGESSSNSSSNSSSTAVISYPPMEIFVDPRTPKDCSYGNNIEFTALLQYGSTYVNERKSMITITSDGFTVIDGMETRVLATARGAWTRFEGKNDYYVPVTYKLQAKEDVKSGYYGVTIKVDYVDIDDKSHSITNKCNIYIEGKQGSESGSTIDVAKPNVIVESYSYGDEYAYAGKPFELEYTLVNTSATTTITNAVVTMTMPDGLAMTNASNAFYIEKLAPKEKLTKTFTVSVKSAAKPESHMIALEASYEYINNDKRATASVKELMAIPVVQQDKFTVDPIEPPMQFWVGQENHISVFYTNKGAAEIRNLSVEIEGNIANPGQNQYMGNIKSGEQGSADFILVATEEGMVECTVKLTYEDSNGLEKTLEMGFASEAMPMPQFDPMPVPDFDPTKQQSQPSKLIIFIAAGVILVLGVGAVVTVMILKKRKVKKLELQLAGDEHEDI